MYTVGQPTMGAWLQAKLTRMRPATPVIVPKPSRRWNSEGGSPASCVDGAAAGMANTNALVKSIATTAIAKYVHGHQASWANRAENSAPTTKLLGAVLAKMLKTMSFLRPGGYVRPRMAMPLGSRRAGPIP